MINNIKEQPYFAYFRVMKHDTEVTRISCNNFKTSSGNVVDFAANVYHLPPDADLFYGYPGLIEALEKAKDGAQTYIEELIEQGVKALPVLLQYRMDHYEDLGVNLVEANIRKLEAVLKLKPNFKWIPYRIGS